MMKRFSVLLILGLLIGCKEKTFADDIVLSFPKETEMEIQEFNEDLDDIGSNLIYVGKQNPEIAVKYYKDILPSPEPLQKLNESNQDYKKRVKKTIDSMDFLMRYYFKTEVIKTFPFKREEVTANEEDEIISEDVPTDNLSNKNIEIIVNEKLTIPLYKKVMGTTEVKAYKAFPVFIRNISNKVLNIPSSNGFVQLYFQNTDKNFQFLRNSNYMICGTGIEPRYFEFKPNDILIYAYPFFLNGTKKKVKIQFYDATSKEFEISIDDKIIQKQRNKYYLQ